MRLYTHSACLEHDPGIGHPESPARLRAVLQALDDPRFAGIERVEAPRATREQLERVHGAEYLDYIVASEPSRGLTRLDPDTVMSPGSLEAALRAAGAACVATDAVLARETRRARIWFFDGFAGKDSTEYTDGEAVDVELLTNTGSVQLDPGLATPMSLTFDQRQARPYPPAAVQINGDWYPSNVTSPVVLTFNHRDRISQADQLVDYSAASVGPETGVTYTLRGYLGTTLDATLADEAGAPITWTPSSTGAARVELVSVRNGIESNVWDHLFTVTGVVPMTTTPTVSVADTAARISFRASAASTVTIEYSTDPDLADASTTAGTAVADTTDFTSAIDISGLAPDTTYYYTPAVNGTAQYSSSYPTFKTFPAAGAPAAFSFAFGSCTKHNGMPADTIFGQVPSGTRFLFHLGDTIYADSDSPAATTLAGYRAKHQLALTGTDSTTTGWKALRAEMPVFVMWDDHDITNDFSGGTSDALYAPAKQAFHEYQGRANPDSLTSGELYYTLAYGDVGFFVADLRSFRSANTAGDDASKTILGATQKAALKSWLLTNKDTFKFKFICASVPAHGYASNTAGDSWGGIDDDTQAPNGANGFRTERNDIWDYIDANQIPGVIILSGDQHWAGSFKTTYAGRPRYEFMASSFNSPVLTPVARAADAVNGPVFWKYGTSYNVGIVTIDTTVSPPTVSFQLYGTSGSLGSSYLTTLDQDQIDQDLVPVPGIQLTADLPDATVDATYTGSVTATNTGGASGAITLTYDALPAGLALGTLTGSGDGPFTWPVTGEATASGDNGLVTEFGATNGTQSSTLDHAWTVSEVVTQTTWSTTNKAADIVLESGNTVATSPSGTTGTGGTVISASGKTSGKFYAELTCTQLFSTWASTGVGLHLGTSALGNYVGQDASGWGTWSAGSDGFTRQTFHSGAAGNATATSAKASGQTARIAVDVGAGKLWLSYLGSTGWIGGGDPSAGTSPTFTFTPGSTAYLAATPRSAAGGSSCTKLLLVDPSNWANSAPAGFGVWT